MKILIATDAWHPQINGVVTTMDNTIKCLRVFGHEVSVITPADFYTFKLPWYKEIDVSYFPRTNLEQEILRFGPERVHVTTEAPVGLFVRNVCVRHKMHISTSYHTDIPSYGQKYLGIPKFLTYRVLRWFHRNSKSVMVANQTVYDTLQQHGFQNLSYWSRGVDTNLFKPRPKIQSLKPIALYVGRIAIEKNLEAFLVAKTNCRKRVVGDGPYLGYYKSKYPDVEFVGAKRGEFLAEEYASADVFVFPSKTDTFGIVMIEALASGLPVAAYPVMGPLDIVTNESVGYLHDDLEYAIEMALKLGDPVECRKHSANFSWQACTQQFLDNLVPI